MSYTPLTLDTRPLAPCPPPRPGAQAREARRVALEEAVAKGTAPGGGDSKGGGKAKDPRREKTTSIKLLCRRGAAHCAAGRYSKGLGDYQTASELAPGDKALSADTARISLLVQAYAHKDTADAALRGGDAEGARRLYDEALGLAPRFVRCLSNRAACRVALPTPDLAGAVEDCTRALRLLQGLEQVARLALR